MVDQKTLFKNLVSLFTKLKEQPADKSDLEINEILYELGECREDERNSQNQMLQVISAAGTIIGICAALVTFLFDHIETDMQKFVNRLLLVLTSCVLCTAFPYITFWVLAMFCVITIYKA